MPAPVSAVCHGASGRVMTRGRDQALACLDVCTGLSTPPQRPFRLASVQNIRGAPPNPSIEALGERMERAGEHGPCLGPIG